ncbi:MAG: Response regulator of zinc sigma-54-dependent two-component system [Myxococcales bacterium]|nr:Response regulator of zinc sigma-54-dependent two-component system [Myxococcales bacterium]
MARSRRDAAPRRELQVKTAPVDDDGRFGRLALILPNGERVSISEALTIGTAEDVDVRIDDPSISRRHCVVEPRDEQVVVRDLGSTNGTQVNGVRVPFADLKPSTVITLGMTRIRVVMDTKIDAEIIGESPAMIKLRADITRLAGIFLPTLILGETGTGKELVARALHDQSGRRGSFVAVNCGSVPKELVESELFGHERGAFTGANARRAGLFQEADGGTLFLDEIGELPLALQTRLLRVLESGMVRPVGATREEHVQVRIIAATHVNLDRAVADGKFRRDLLYRLNAAVIHTPALRTRRTDIALLVDRLLQDEAAQGHRCQLSDEAMTALLHHAWPGNVRELKNVVKRAAAMGGSTLYPHDLKLGSTVLTGGDDTVTIAGQTMEQIVKEVLSRTVRRCHGNQRAASVELAMPRSTLNDKLRRYGIDLPANVRPKQRV